MSGEAILKIDGLHTYYGRAHILADLELEARRGEVVVLLGRNGAGKSTTMKSVIGLVPAAKGTIAFNGQRIERTSPHRIAQQGLGYVPEDRRIFTELTVMENLEVGRQPPRGFTDLDTGPPVRTVSESGPDERPARWQHVRRRAADADHCPHPDGQPTADPAG